MLLFDAHDGLVPEFCTVHGLDRIPHGNIEPDTPDLLEAVVKHSVLAVRFISNGQISLKRQRVCVTSSLHARPFS